jgi:hypothetical protein
MKRIHQSFETAHQAQTQNCSKHMKIVLFYFLNTHGFTPRSCCRMLLSCTLLHFQLLPLLLAQSNKNTSPQCSGQSNLEKAAIMNDIKS